MEQGVLARIRRAIRSDRYIISDHALDEAGFDDLLEADILDVLLTGILDSVYTDDPRGPRYVVRGEVESVEVDVVCRFDHEGTLLIIITVYLVV